LGNLGAAFFAVTMIIVFIHLANQPGKDPRGTELFAESPG
jgi:hypothetical protein